MATEAHVAFTFCWRDYHSLYSENHSVSIETKIPFGPVRFEKRCFGYDGGTTSPARGEAAVSLAA